MRYTPNPVPDEGLSSFVGVELARLARVLKTLEVDTLTTSLGGSRFTPQVLVTTHPTATPDALSGFQPLTALMGAGTSGAFGTWFNVESYLADASGPAILLKKSRGATIGAHAIVANGDPIAALNAYASDATTWVGVGAVQIVMNGAVQQGAPLWLPTSINYYVVPDQSAANFLVAKMYALAAGTPRFDIFDNAGNSVVGLGGVNGHGGQALAAIGGATYAISYFYSQNFAVVRGYLGHNGTNFEWANTINSSASNIFVQDSTGNQRAAIQMKGGVGQAQLGFFATAPINKVTVAGAKGGNAALASLCTQLANYGLIIDTTT